MSSKLILVLLLVTTACMRAPLNLEPRVKEPRHPREIMRQNRSLVILPEDFSVSPFEPLTDEEVATEWGKEYKIALHFAGDFDLYRAITGFKRAQFFEPSEERSYEIYYATALAYFLGKKYKEVAYIAESTPLGKVSNHFPAFRDLVLILSESYRQLGNVDHANNLIQLLEEEEKGKLQFLSIVQEANFEALTACAEDRPYLKGMLNGYEREAKSVRKAELLNALLPGAGYYYVGQKQTAVTAFLVNSLFLGTAAYFFIDGNLPAGIITLSLEGGWYFGGIYGAGLSAKSYNEKLYSRYAEKIGEKEKFHPQLMLKYSF